MRAMFMAALAAAALFILPPSASMLGAGLLLLAAAAIISFPRVGRLLLTAFGLIGLFSVAAYAQTVATAPASSVSMPIGDWIGYAAELIAAISAAAVAYLFRFLPASVQQILTTMQAEQLLGKAIDYALNAVAGAEKGKTLDVKVGSAVVATSVQYAIDHGPAWLVEWLGGAAAIEQKIIARLSLGADAAVATTTAIVPATSAPAPAPVATTIVPAGPAASTSTGAAPATTGATAAAAL